MELQKASAWYFNDSKTTVVLNDIGVTLAPGEIVDLFKKQPNLTWDRLSRSRHSGVLAGKPKIKFLDRPPVKMNASQHTTYDETELPVVKPISSRCKSCLFVPTGQEDYLAVIEGEFSGDSQQLGQTEMWKTERDKFLKTIEHSELGSDGEIFSDNIFEDEYLSQ